MTTNLPSCLPYYMHLLVNKYGLHIGYYLLHPLQFLTELMRSKQILESKGKTHV